jgi:hypothetical protein
MRFLPDGADIPDDLIHAVARGDAVFLCGAGVSKAAGMPLFDELTEQVYERLPATREDEAPEQEAFDRREYDRVLRALEKRTRRIGNPQSRVREVVTEVLATTIDPPLLDHISLMKLSQDRGGRPRLLTTNFDTLFERAARKAGMTCVPSHAGKSLPKPGGPRDYGVLHLHGRIGDYPPWDETDLVLTSSDFGDAYLRDGWASQYIEERMRLNVLILVGYAANDTAFRLLLEALDADRERFRDLQKIYAIDKGGDSTAAHWRAKGIEPIEFGDYKVMYATLSEWSCYNTSPISYRRHRIKDILAKVPKETVSFEHEQLRFMLNLNEGVAGIMEFSPSFAWMPFFAKWGMIRQGEPGLLLWIDHNLSNEQAFRDVVSNIHLLGSDAAEYLDESLRRNHDTLPALFVKSWRIIQRQIRNNRLKTSGREWLMLGLRVQHGEFSSDLYVDLARSLRPRIIIKSRGEFYQVERAPAKNPRDLMSIEFEVDDLVSVESILQIWPEDTLAQYDCRLLDCLTNELESALHDAVDAGVEGEGRDTYSAGWGRSDSDVPSIAASIQNNYRSGFQAIARFTAELWSRLARKDAALALPQIERWGASQFRLFRRLALFACADSIVPAEVAAKMLNSLPQGELFLTGSAVEVIRLLRARWREWPDPTREAIEHRLCSGPAAECFHTNVEKAVDSSIYGVLGQLQQEGFPLGGEALSTLSDIGGRWPDWRPRPTEQAGFHIWAGSVETYTSDTPSLADIPDEQLVTESRRLNEGLSFPGEVWADLCRGDPERALRGLELEATRNRWPDSEWKIMLTSSASFNQPEFARRISLALVDCDSAVFSEIAASAASWLGYCFREIDDGVIWRLWDLTLDASLDEQRDLDGEDDLLRVSMSAPAGYLADILVQRMPTAEFGASADANSVARLDRLVSAEGSFGILARVRLSAELSRLYFVMPDWTAKKLVPLFDWASPDARAAWLARGYSRYIGSPELFGLTKTPFLAMFRRNDIPRQQRAAFAEWLVVMMMSNLAHGEIYPLTFPEAQSALRRAGVEALRKVGHRLATTMQGAAPENKAVLWRDIVRPVFQGLWPLDIDLRSSSLTLTFVNILIEAGDAFPAASEIIIPFIEPEERGHQTALFSIARAQDVLFDLSPEKMLNLITAVVGDAPPGSLYQLGHVLERVRAVAPHLADTRLFQRLLGMAAIM